MRKRHHSVAKTRNFCLQQISLFCRRRRRKFEAETLIPPPAASLGETPLPHIWSNLARWPKGIAGADLLWQIRSSSGSPGTK